MVVARRVEGMGGVRVLAAAVDVDGLADRLVAAGLPSGSRLAIVDGAGRVAFDAPDGARVGTPFEFDADGLRATGRATVVRAGQGGAPGTSLVLAGTPLLTQDDGATFVLSVPAEALLPDGRPDLGRAAALTIVVLGGLFTVASLALSRLVFRPIRVLELAMQRVADGDLTSRVAPGARRGELRTLAAAFDGMTRALRHQRRALAQATDALAEREHELRLLAANLVDLVYATDAAGRITYASPSYREGLGYDPERLIGHDPLSLVHPDDVAAVATLLDTELREGAGHVRTEARLRGADGADHWFELIVRPRRGPDGAHLGTQGTLRDVTERKRLEALLAEQALNDPLTGLPNRRSFDAVVERLLSQAKRSGELVAVGFVDLDDFKAVNDTHGHQAGDVLLQEVAARLRAAVREGDVVARLGGDEFTLALRELQDEHHARAVAERIAAAFATPFELGVTSLTARASVGVALFPAHGEDPEALLRAADRAMYLAKGDGKGRVAFAEAADGDVGERGS
jgi:diguanylate cyclase (GGDEF)-like protein/PAS domain S-box-containing protein